ncbi:unnamed protein product, partial [Coccothraustes coccothraustes]
MSSNFRDDICREFSGSAPAGGTKQMFGQGTQIVVTSGVFGCVYSGSANRLTFGSGTRLLVKP